MKDALAVHRALLERQAHHEIVRLPGAIADADELPRVLGLPADRCPITRLYECAPPNEPTGSGGFGGPDGPDGPDGPGVPDGPGGPGRPGGAFLVAVIVAAGARPRARRLSRAVAASRVRPARPDTINAVTDYAAGLVCPLLLPEKVPLLIDERLVDLHPADTVLYTATGEASTALGIRALDLCTLSGAKPVPLTTRPGA